MKPLATGTGDGTDMTTPDGTRMIGGKSFVSTSTTDRRGCKRATTSSARLCTSRGATHADWVEDGTTRHDAGNVYVYDLGSSDSAITGVVQLGADIDGAGEPDPCSRGTPSTIDGTRIVMGGRSGNLGSVYDWDGRTQADSMARRGRRNHGGRDDARRHPDDRRQVGRHGARSTSCLTEGASMRRRFLAARARKQRTTTFASSLAIQVPTTARSPSWARPTPIWDIERRMDDVALRRRVYGKWLRGPVDRAH